MQIAATVVSSAARHDVTVRTGGTSQHLLVAPKGSGYGSSINGGEFLMLALATCYCNDLFREAARLGIPIQGAEVEASGEFPGVGLAASNITYRAKVHSPAPSEEVERLLRETDAVAEVHNTIRSGVPVRLVQGASVRLAHTPPGRRSTPTLDLMRETVLVRRYRPGEEPALFEVYHSAIHLVASRDYSPEQIAAWAPDGLDAALWESRIRGINPFVAELDGIVVAYADLQPSGYIDHFFVSGAYPRRGFGAALMRRILDEARHLGLSELTSDVSRTAQGFYERYGFRVVEHRSPVVRGVMIPNALMRLELKNA